MTQPDPPGSAGEMDMLVFETYTITTVLVAGKTTLKSITIDGQ